MDLRLEGCDHRARLYAGDVGTGHWVCWMKTRAHHFFFSRGFLDFGSLETYLKKRFDWRKAKLLPVEKSLGLGVDDENHVKVLPISEPRLLEIIYE